MAKRGIFIGVGIDEYDGLRDLSHAVSDVRAVAARLEPSYDNTELLNATARQVDDHLESITGTATGRSLVLLWSGHGTNHGGLRLATKDKADKLAASEVIRSCVESGANQLLFIIDTCQSEAATNVYQQAKTWLADTRSVNDNVWFGFLVSCSTEDYGARDGAFGRLLVKLLTHGPDSPDQKRRWSRHNRFILGEDLGQALLEEWTNLDQRPHFLRDGTAWHMLPNPLWTEGAQAEVVEHLLLAAHAPWFTGRTTEVAQVVAWITARNPGVHVITGSAGTGKSAVLGHVVSEHAVTASVHARGLTADRMADLLDGQLVRAGFLPAQPEGRRNAAELVGAVQRAVTGDATAAVIVIDGLDEARHQARTITNDLVARLSPFASVIVSVRPDDRDLLEALAATETLDLDQHHESGRAAVHDYVRARLSDVDARMDAAAVAAHLADRPFLLARIITDQLRAVPVDTTTPDWRNQIARSTEEAFDAELAEGNALARPMLTALTWALGAGFPEEEWLAVASLLAGTTLERGHVTEVLDQLGRYVVQDGEAGVAVYRLAHQSLADHLRPPYRPTGDRPFDPAALPVVKVLLERYTDLLAKGVEPSYLPRYAWAHAAEAGFDGLAEYRRFVRSNTTLAPSMAEALLDVADRAAEWGQRSVAVAPTEEAVRLHRFFVERGLPHLLPLANALSSLCSRYMEVGRDADAVTAAEEAVALCRTLADKDPVHLAIGLVNLANAYRGVGRWEDAVRAAEQSVAHLRDLTTTDPSTLALALNGLGIHLRALGRTEEALAAAEEAVELGRRIVVSRPVHLPALARALTNLANTYGSLGRRAEAVRSADEALTHFRAIAAANPGHLPALAEALSNLGGHHSMAGRTAEALALTEEAVALLRAHAEDDHTLRAVLAHALSNLGARYSEAGADAEAIGPAEEAVALNRALCADNPGRTPGLAAALVNLGVICSKAGRTTELLRHTQEAVELFRTLVDAGRGYLPRLATALDNLGAAWRDCGRPDAAVDAATEAVAHHRLLAAEGREHVAPFARSLTYLGAHLRAAGRASEALGHTEQAVALYRSLSPDNSTLLASALVDLCHTFDLLGRSDQATTAAEEAVALYRSLPDHPTGLIGALHSLANLQQRTGRVAEAVALLEEAVQLCRAETPRLASLLRDLGAAYEAVGRGAEAITVLRKAVALYLRAPDRVIDLAGTLHQLSRLTPADADAAWQAAMDAVGSGSAGGLLLYRAMAAEDGDPRTATWLHAITDSEDRDLCGLARRVARERWGDDAVGWAVRTGQTPPAWLTVSADKMALVQQWCATAGEAERDFVIQHPELLDEAFDVAVDEVLLRATSSSAAAERHERRLKARAQGAEAAYRPLVLLELATAFSSSDTEGRRRLLTERREDLLDDVAGAILRNHDDPMPLALLDVARVDRAGLLDATFDALLDPTRFEELLDATASTKDSSGLREVAAVAYYAADQATAGFYLAVAAAIDGDDHPEDYLAEARELAPGSAGAWITRLAELGAVHPEVLPLIRVLTTPDHDR